MSERILVVGGGGREHALVRQLLTSPHRPQLWVAPGNGGTAGLGPRVRNVAISAEDVVGLLALCQRERIDLCVVGPEAPLVAGLADALAAAGVPCFGPCAAAARLEGSKAFAKALMVRVGIPTARSATFQDPAAARDYVTNTPWQVVVKASGLAAGKGVMVCDDAAQALAAIDAVMVERAFGAAGDEILIEERLRGQEVSVLAFCDGRHIALLPPAQDHKAAYEGDTGPNTGGMGAYAPAPVLDAATLNLIGRTVLQAAVDGLADDGVPFVGVLYAGIMLTEDGPRVLEFNVRLGDPETQALLPLLATDLLEIFEACVRGRLPELEISWHGGAAATVVAAAGGYPGPSTTGLPITGVQRAGDMAGVEVIHAGTRLDDDGALRTNGGRVLAVTGRGADLTDALELAYAGLDHIHFEGLHYRSDIGGRVLGAAHPRSMKYRAAGVDLAAGVRAIELMKAAVESTHGEEVLAGVGAFGGLFDARRLAALNTPVLVASTDGVGTKTRIAAATGRWSGIGQDLVNHCIDDILVQGATPLFFLDYVASSRLLPEQVAAIVGGCATACRAAGCALLGGETAEMPGVYAPGEVDVVGTIVGMVDRAAVIDGHTVVPGDKIIGMAPSGLHTNGYSLARAIIADQDLLAPRDDLGGRSLADTLLAPHRAYLAEVRRLREGVDGLAGVDLKGLAHITGGGLVDNPPRILPPGVAMTLHMHAWPRPDLFALLQRLGGVSEAEMRHVFNVGVGMLAVVPAAEAERAMALLDAPGLAQSWLVGEVTVRGAGAAVVFP